MAVQVEDERERRQDGGAERTPGADPVALPRPLRPKRHPYVRQSTRPSSTNETARRVCPAGPSMFLGRAAPYLAAGVPMPIDTPARTPMYCVDLTSVLIQL